MKFKDFRVEHMLPTGRDGISSFTCMISIDGKPVKRYPCFRYANEYNNNLAHTKKILVGVGDDVTVEELTELNDAGISNGCSISVMPFIGESGETIIEKINMVELPNDIPWTVHAISGSILRNSFEINGYMDVVRNLVKRGVNLLSAHIIATSMGNSGHGVADYCSSRYGLLRHWGVYDLINRTDGIALASEGWQRHLSSKIMERYRYAENIELTAVELMNSDLMKRLFECDKYDDAVAILKKERSSK